MDPLEQIVLGGQSVLRGATESVRRPLPLPWIAWLGVQLVIVLVLVQFAHPWLSWFMAPLIRRLAGEPALHYPDALLALPGVFARIVFVLGMLALPPLLGWSAVMLARRFGRKRVDSRQAWRETLRRLPKLVVCLVPWWLASAWVARASADALDDLGGSPLRALARLAATEGLEAALLVVACLMLPVVAVAGPPLTRFGDELERAWRRSGLAAAVIALGFEAGVVMSRLAANAASLRLAGERIEGISAAVALGAAFAAATQLLFCSSSVVVYATAVEDEAWRSGF